MTIGLTSIRIEAVVAHCKVLSRHLRTGTEENHETILRSNRCLGRGWKQICFDCRSEAFQSNRFCALFRGEEATGIWDKSTYR